jgi:glutathione S-transferase
MSLKLYYHPLSSFCHKALIALYENDVPFEPVFVDLGDEKSSAQLRTLWPVAKFPVIRDEARKQTVAEATIIIEYLDTHYPGPTKLVPADSDLAWQVRMWDRFYDNYVHIQMQKVIGDGLRPADAKDGFGVEQARAMVRRAYDMIETRMSDRTWMVGDSFSLADCSAAPALFYADVLLPMTPRWPSVQRYLDRLMSRGSYARVLQEAEPYFHLVPSETKPTLKRVRENS